MRIVQIHNAYRQRGGEDVQVETEAQALRAAGHDLAQVLSRNPSNPRASAFALARAPHNRRSAERALAAVMQKRPDVVHLHNTWFEPSPAVFEALAANGVPSVLTLHNYRLVCVQGLLFRDGHICTKCVGASPLSGVRHRCYRGSLGPSALAAATIGLGRARGSWDAVDRMIAPSSALKDVLIQGGLSGDQISVVANMVDDPGGRSAPPSRSRKVMYIGRLTREKGVDIAISAWAGVAAELGLELDVLGDGPLRAELAKNLPPGVRLLGWRSLSYVRQALAEARALVFPTRCLEPFGRGAVEAFAAGAPVLGSALGATGEIVSQLGPEWIVEGEKPSDWRRALALLAHDAIVDETGQRARTVFERRYSTDVVRTDLEAVYRSAMGH